ncbi:MAG: cation diffusion facilitator family transporter [Spirulina sp.]
MNEEKNAYFVSRLVLLATLWLMGLVFWVKLSVGWEARSLGLLVQCLHTLIICFNALLGFLAAIGSDRPDGREIYGHGKKEVLLTFALVAVLAIASFLFFETLIPQSQAALKRETLPFPLEIKIPVLQFLGFVSLPILGIASFSLYQAQRLDHAILAFNANQLFKEAGLTLLICAGLWGVWWGEPLIDLVLSVIMYILVLDEFWQAIAWNLPLMVEQNAISADAIASIAKSVRGVSHCYRIRARGIVGQFVYIQMHLILEPRYEKAATGIARKIEEALRLRYGSLQVTFYIDAEAKRSGILR